MVSGQHAMGRLVSALTKLPGVGKKSAQRMAYYILQNELDYAVELSESILGAKEKIRLCSMCHDYTESDPCHICSDERRDKNVLCVVEQPKDLAAMERSRQYNGRYHILHGVINPRENKGLESLTLNHLLSRVDESIEEVIIALNPTVEGDTTAIYIARLLRPLGIKVTRIAQGIPTGSDLDYFDETTIAMAVENRREIKE
ncbi:MAG: recombination protein RecR [Tissierellia bacterium]|nr:recombination protein RecR [Tissierellia bacterium]